MQENDKKEMQIQYEKDNKEILALIEKVNSEGLYYRGTVGLDQYFYYSFTNMRLQTNVVYTDVYELVIFFKEESIHAEYRFKEWMNFEKFGVELYQQIDKDTFDNAINSLKALQSLWNGYK